MKEPSLKNIFLVFLKIGSFAFGGVYSMLAFFERELVHKNKWLNEEEFSEAVAIGQLTPGAPIINTGIFIGYRLRRLKGALITIIGQVLPSLIIVIILGYIYIKYREIGSVKAFLKGIGAAVVGLLLSVIYKLGKKILNSSSAIAIGLAVFILAILKINPIMLLVLSGLTGLILYRRRNV
ncbi:MAG: chromate transporter [Thermodesulfovibrionales bacterium]